MDDPVDGLKLMRASFPAHQIGKLPKGSKAQTQCQPSEKQNCAICGGWHHPKMIHLDYIGHAALTDRLLDADPGWFWQPLALKDGLPAFDSDGGLWIILTVCGVSRLGYGNAAESEYKEIGSRQKEVIGDALRNAAMRFGAALELWHKGDLHVESKETPGQIVDQAIAMEGMVPEVSKAIRDEALKIGVDFYQVGAKAALGSWLAFKKSAGEQEIEALWKHLDSRVRAGIKKVGSIPEEVNVETN